MAAISQTINNVLGGVSQQPDPVKLPGQVREAKNVYLDPTFGCSKRPGTKFINKLADNIPQDAFWFSIFRSSTERYVGCIYYNTIRVWDADTGVESTVNVASGANEYLRASGRNILNFRNLTVNDYTFILNNQKRVTTSTTRVTGQQKESLSGCQPSRL